MTEAAHLPAGVQDAFLFCVDHADDDAQLDRLKAIVGYRDKQWQARVKVLEDALEGARETLVCILANYKSITSNNGDDYDLQEVIDAYDKALKIEPGSGGGGE